MKPAILVIDMIVDFVSGTLGSERFGKIVPNIRRIISYGRRVGIPLIYVTDAHLQGDHEFKVWPSHALKGSKGAQILPTLKPNPGDYHLEKRRYSAFYDTGLGTLLRTLKRDTLVLTGVVTNICIQHTAADAFFRGYNVLVPSDCVEAANEETQKAALLYMKEMYGAEITSRDDLLAGRLEESD